MNLEITEKVKIKNNKPTMCLNMIVKNESKVIFDTLKNLTDKINFDYWVISDTGSTDGTQDMIQTFFWNKGIPGEIVNHEWQDFGHNRTKALEAAYGKTDYLLIFDADDSLHGDFNLPFDKKPLADRYMLKIGLGFEYVRPLLINNRKRWMFKGVLHEYLHNLEPVNHDITIKGNYHIESGRTGNRSQNPTKYYDDAVILKNAYEKEMALPDKGMSGRYAFYCARSFKDAGEKYHDDAIIWYKKVIDMQNHWNQERYYSALEIGHIYKEKKQMEEACKYFIKTVEFDIERIEGIAIAIEHYYQTGQYILVNALYHKFKDYKQVCVPKLGEKLFVNRFFYNDRLEFFNGIIAYYVNDKVSGYNCCKQVLINQLVGQNELTITLNNLIYYREIMEKDDTLKLFYVIDEMIYKNNELVYNNAVSELWELLFKQNRSQLTVLDRNARKKVIATANEKGTQTAVKEKILITFTTCKRLDLFKETINSILKQWTDVDLITDWFCVDDNSSNEDRQFMKSTYHWMDYYMKTPSEKGHRVSMNIIWNKLYDLKPKYWIHMEDDFIFYHPMNYVTQAMETLKNKAAISLGIKQIVFNRNYAETVDNYKSKGHLSTQIPNIVLHHHRPNESITHYQNSHYWPHYSFRPGMIDVKSILKLGNYDSPNKFFERDYADKWNKANYKTAFFDRITHRHTGRLTSEIRSGSVKNAYELNGEDQFNGKEKEKAIKLLNLERRSDRKLQMSKQFNEVGLDNAYTIFKAIDGNELEPTLELKLLFDGNDFGNRSGIIGCALSHLKMWRELLEDKDNNYYVIFEDDFTLTPVFKENFTKLTPEFEKTEFLLLGYHMYENKRETVKAIYDVIEPSTVFKVAPLNKDLYIGGFFAYTINKVGAKKLIDYIELNGIKHGIDYLIKIMPELNPRELQPHLVLSVWNEVGKKPIDTDIQQNFKTLDFNKTIEDQFEFIPKLDQIGNDLYFERGLSLTDYMLKAIKDKNCIGFNTLGFFKSKVDSLTTSQYFREKDGIYIKRGVPPPAPHLEAEEVIEIGNQDSNETCAQACGDVFDKEPGVEVCTQPVSGGAGACVLTGGAGACPRVKLLGNWCSSEQLCKEWSNMCIKDYTWNNIKITWSNDEREIDYYVIINKPLPGDKYISEKTIVFQMEPWIQDSEKNWGVKTWGEWASPDPSKFFKVFTHKTHLNNVQWQIVYPFYERKEIDYGKGERKNKVATICSQKNFDTGHILRNQFIKSAEEAGVVDVWGSQNYHGFKNYIGMIDQDNKFNVYANYKYCFSAENNSEINYATEKIWEPILCESLCFYWGCPNLEEYLDPKAFVRLPLEDPQAALKIIQQAIAEDWWSQRIDIIKQMKEKILNELGFFPLLERLLITKN